MTFADPTRRCSGTFGMVVLDPLARLAAGDGGCSSRRQRLRRGGRRRRSCCTWSSRTSTARAARCPAIFATAQDPAPRVLCGQGPAPAGATIEHYRDSASTWCPAPGPLAAAVPGAVDAWLLLLRDHGTRPLRRRARAARSATPRDGHPLLARVGATVAGVRAAVRGATGRRPPSCGCPAAGRRRAGELFGNPAYAARLQRLSPTARPRGGGREAQIDAARRAWSQGFVAEAVDAFRRRPFRDSGGEAHAGAGHRRGPGRASPRPRRTPAHTRVRTASRSPRRRPGARDRCCCRPRDARRASPTRRRSTRPPLTASTPSTEVLKLAFADREAWYGDGGRRPLDDPARPGVRRRARRAWSATRPSASCGPGRPGGASRGCRARAGTGGRAAAPGGRDHRRADRASGRGDPRRHLPRRRGRPLGQHGLRDARAAAGCRARRRSPSSASAWAAGCRCSGSRRGCRRRWRPGRRPRTTLTPDAGAARRGAGAGLRHARRRPAGPVAAAVPAAPPRAAA